MPARRRAPSLPEPHVANVLGAVALDAVTRTAGAIESATSLSMVQATALTALANYADGQSIDILRRSVDLTHSATVRMVDRLVELGLVERRAAVDDARIAAVHLTAAGRRAVRKARRARATVLDDLIGRLSPADRAELGRLLDKTAGSDVVPREYGMDGANYVCRLCDPGACGHPAQCPVTEAARATR